MYRSAAYSRRPRSAKAGVLAPSPFSKTFKFLWLITCLVFVVLLTGCAQPGQMTVKSTQKKTTTSTDAPKAAAPEPVASVGVSGGWQSGETLLGLGSEDIRAALGAPARIRDENPARIYQYVGGDCVLDLFLYQEAGTYRVTYAEARSAKAESQPVDACLKSMPSPVVAANTQPST